MSNTKLKSKILGENISTAYSKLRKKMLFKMVKMCGLDVCYRCGIKIYTEKELSIEHKIPWQYSDNPSKTFYDLDNVCFSHLKCNSGDRANPSKRLNQHSKIKK